MKNGVQSKLAAGRRGETKRRRKRPKYRMVRSPTGKIQKLFINGRIERVNFGHDVDPETCAFLPILNQIVVISNVEAGVRCYAKPLKNEERGYQILTFAEQEVIDGDEAERHWNSIGDAVQGLTFRECALNCADVREKYLQTWPMRNLNNASVGQKAAPELFIRYGERVAWRNE